MGPGISLIVSSSTLVCCALPALLVTVGLGAAVAGLVTAAPGLIWLSERKAWVFGIAGLALVSSEIVRRRKQSQTCPANAAAARTCRRARRLGGALNLVSFATILVGAMFAYVLPRL